MPSRLRQLKERNEVGEPQGVGRLENWTQHACSPRPALFGLG